MFLRMSSKQNGVCFAGAGGNQSSGPRDGGRGREAKGAAERGGETDEPEPPTRCVCALEGDHFFLTMCPHMLSFCHTIIVSLIRSFVPYVTLN